MSSNESAPSTPGYFSFQTFITPLLVKILYVLWSIVIILGWPVATIIAFANGGAVAGIVAGIGGFFACVISLVSARLVCEMMIVIFRIYEELRDRKM